MSDSTDVPTPVSDVIAKMDEILNTSDTDESASDIRTLAEYVKGMPCHPLSWRQPIESRSFPIAYRTHTRMSSTCTKLTHAYQTPKRCSRRILRRLPYVFLMTMTAI